MFVKCFYSINRNIFVPGSQEYEWGMSASIKRTARPHAVTLGSKDGSIMTSNVLTSLPPLSAKELLLLTFLRFPILHVHCHYQTRHGNLLNGNGTEYLELAISIPTESWVPRVAVPVSDSGSNPKSTATTHNQKLSILISCRSESSN